MAKKNKTEDASKENEASENIEIRTMSSRDEARKQLDDDISRYLQQGGEIETVEKNVMADPPRKPVSNYGSRPI